MSTENQIELRRAVEQAVASGVPRTAVSLRVLDVAATRRAAVALVILNADSTPYAVLSVCELRPSGWTEIEFTDGGGAAVTAVPGGWVSYTGGPAPNGTSIARVSHQGDVIESKVQGGYFLSVTWDLAAGEDTAHPALPSRPEFS